MSARAQPVISVAGGKFCHAEFQFAGTDAPDRVVSLAAQTRSCGSLRAGRYLRAAGVSVVSFRSLPRMYTTFAGWPIFSTSSAYV